MTLDRMARKLKLPQAVPGLIAGALLVLAVMAVFAIELANTQAKSRGDVIARVHERAVLAGSLIDSLFQTVQAQVPQDSATYGGRTVSPRTMDAHRQNNTYLALLDPSSRILASSSGFTAQARSDLMSRGAAALRLLRSGRPYGLGNLLPYGRTGVINLAVSFPTRYGRRILLSGTSPPLLSQFLAGELRRIPGVKGSHNYVVDGNDTVIASTNPARPAGYRFTQQTQVAALAHSSGERGGHYYVQVPISNATWRIVLSAPSGPLFASVSGWRKWVSWSIFGAFALVAAIALALGRRALRSAEDVREANAQLATVNSELEATNLLLERRAAELARSNVDLNQFASIASHDLQEPLRKVRTFTDQLVSMDSDGVSEQARDYAVRASGAAKRMQNLIQDLLRFSRVRTHGRPFGPVDLSEVTREVLGDLSAEIERTGAVVNVGSLPTISADPLQMRQLMQNLVSNALKFRRSGVVPEVTIEATVAGEEAQIAVRDNGIGFDPRYAARIFRVFERLHGRGEYPGTGIGLALCRKIVERHVGSITAESTLGVGSVFTVTLPVHPQEEALAAPEAAPEQDLSEQPSTDEQAHVPV